MASTFDAAVGSVFVAVRIPAPIAAQFPPEVEEPHVTLVYAGEGDVPLWESVSAIVADELGARWTDLGRERWRETPPTNYDFGWCPIGQEWQLADIAYFDKDAGRVAYAAAIPSESINAFQGRLVARIEALLGRKLENADPWVPHATLGKLEAGQPWTGSAPRGSWRMADVEVWAGPDRRMVINHRRVWRFERINGSWTAALGGGEHPLEDTFGTYGEAVAAATQADIQRILHGKYSDSKRDESKRDAKSPAVITQPKTLREVLRSDSIDLLPPQLLPSGWMVFDATCSKAGNTQIYHENGREVVEYRPAEVVFDATTIASGVGVPWELLHSPNLLTRDTVLHKVRGCMIDHRVGEDGIHTRGTLVAWDGTLTDSILLDAGSREYGVCRQTSMAYYASIDDRPGTTDDGVRFDRRTAAIIHNSIASCPEGRAGTTRVGLPRGDSRPTGQFQYVSHADALLQIARAGKLPPKPIYFSRSTWGARKDADQMNLIESLLKAAGKTQSDLAVALGISDDELAAMLAMELSPEQLDKISAAIMAMAAPSPEESSAGMVMGDSPKPVPLDIDGTAYMVDPAVNDLITKLRATAASGATKMDALERAEKQAKLDLAKAQSDSATKISHADAQAMVAREATEIAELISVTRQLRGVEFKPPSRKDSADKELPTDRSDWERALLMAHYGDEVGAVKAGQLDAKKTREARAERFADFMAEIRDAIQAKSSTLSTIKSAIAANARSTHADAAGSNPDSAVLAAKAKAAAAAAGQTPASTN